MTKQQFDAQQCRKGMKCKTKYGEAEISRVDFEYNSVFVKVLEEDQSLYFRWLPCEEITLID